MIKAVVFDQDEMLYIEGVLFSERLSKDCNVPVDKVVKFFNTDYKLCQKGKSDIRDLLPKYFPEWNWTKGVDALLKYWFDYGDEDKGIVTIVKKLRQKGIKCILCTNNEKRRMDWLIRKYHWKKLFDHIICSGEVGTVKPELKMFEKIEEVAGFPRQQILFCDDKPHFIEKAREFGFVTHLYKDLVVFAEKLTQKGIL